MRPPQVQLTDVLSVGSFLVAFWALIRTYGRRVDWRVVRFTGAGYSLINVGWGKARRVSIDSSNGVELLSHGWPADETFESEPGRSWPFSVMPHNPNLAHGWHLRVRHGRLGRWQYVPMPTAPDHALGSHSHADRGGYLEGRRQR